MARQQYADGPFAASCKVADVYNDDTQNDMFTEAVDTSTYHGLQHHKWKTSQSELTYIAFQPESLLSIWDGADLVTTKNRKLCQKGTTCNRKPCKTRTPAKPWKQKQHQ